MTWTKKRPTRSGWYWYKQANVEPQIMRLYPAPGYDNKLVVEGVLPLSSYRGYWAGPVEQPT